MTANYLLEMQEKWGWSCCIMVPFEKIQNGCKDGLQRFSKRQNITLLKSYSKQTSNVIWYSHTNTVMMSDISCLHNAAHNLHRYKNFLNNYEKNWYNCWTWHCNLVTSITNWCMPIKKSIFVNNIVVCLDVQELFFVKWTGALLSPHIMYVKAMQYRTKQNRSFICEDLYIHTSLYKTYNII